MKKKNIISPNKINLICVLTPGTKKSIKNPTTATTTAPRSSVNLSITTLDPPIFRGTLCSFVIMYVFSGSPPILALGVT